MYYAVGFIVVIRVLKREKAMLQWKGVRNLKILCFEDERRGHEARNIGSV